MSMDFVKIKRALLSVSDKQGLIPLANCLQQHGCEIISTGGTGRKLQEAGIPFTDISQVTGNPEAFGGRMKTISFTIESALLFDREKDAAEAAQLSIEPIDMVVCNLYPFKKVLDAGSDFETLIENIDIGGPTMVRAAAKNFKYVATVTHTSDYACIIEELNGNSGALSYQTRKALMRRAFNHTADYDAMIAVAMDKEDNVNSMRLAFSGGRVLRYGENSHQKAVYYRENEAISSLYDMKVLHGKALSFNNLMDINAAIEAVRTLNPSRHACSVVKHNNPCGLSESDSQKTAMVLAWQGDPVSAFGSIIAFNQIVQKEAVTFLQLDAKKRSQRKFVEVVVAPKFTDEALAYLQQHKNLRIIECDIAILPKQHDLRYFNGLLLKQDLDTELLSKFEVVSETLPSQQNTEALTKFGLTAISNIKSNSIVVVREHEGSFQLLGMGAGQPNRLVATKLALDKAKENIAKLYEGEASGLAEYTKAVIANSVMVSDAFFPFEDNVELAATYGVKTIVQPGGSIRDKNVVDCCNRLGIAMIMTGIRHFKH